ncbi:DUF2933 domain-containing protein [Cognatishimia activa]|uniref:DUF2933 domain-containing protein n=1 Tax=Cognatishimia activa TaxID=1715691 RepID=UPI0022304B0C|nr:DUF2933 domain-containing protein [Cognatishimia activa]UZD90853.1 DUF2933 domain-containing protein [Cognatishimia activa]
MAESIEKAAKKGFGVMHAGMVICCAIMLIPVAGYFIAGGTLTGLSNNFGVFAPIALCIGVHVAMFAFMGRSCHGNAKTKTETSNEIAELEPERISAKS